MIEFSLDKKGWPLSKSAQIETQNKGYKFPQKISTRETMWGRISLCSGETLRTRADAWLPLDGASTSGSARFHVRVVASPWPRVYSAHGRSLPTWQYWLMGIACIPWYAPFDMRALASPIRRDFYHNSARSSAAIVAPNVSHGGDLANRSRRCQLGSHRRWNNLRQREIVGQFKTIPQTLGKRMDF